MAANKIDPVNIQAFWRVYSALVDGLLREGAHAEVTLVLRDRGVQIVRVNRTFLPGDLPQIPQVPGNLHR